MTVYRSEIRAGAYYDSVVLMQLQRALADLPGVIDAGVVMATPANCELLEASGFTAVPNAGSDDLLIVVKAEDASSADAAIGQVDELLTRRRGSTVQSFRPRSLEAAVKQLPEADFVLVSVPGRYAASVARDALRLGKHVFLFSDNVSVADEMALKNEGRDKGLLVMGPDCGTAIIDGVGLGFANLVRRGSIGIVGASGTGMQAISSAIHNLGHGVSQAIGTGGRDLKQEIGAITTRQGLTLLASDPDTRVIVLVSKPPEKGVAAQLLTMAAGCSKPVVVDFIGYSPPARQMGPLHFASSLNDAAQLAVSLAVGTNRNPSEVRQTGDEGSAGFLRGLFSGGTLAYEAMLGLQAFLQPLYSNIPIFEEQRLDDPLKSREHTVLDLGEDVFTQGRLHPMMDNDLRLRRMAQEVAEANVSMIMLDVVLGEGAHPDPASEIAPAVEQALGEARRANRPLDFVVVVIGSDADAQQLEAQVERMSEAGAIVFQDTVEAVNYARMKLAPTYTDAGQPLKAGAFQGSLAAINVGLETFYDSLVAQGAAAVHVEWRPPAGGNEKLLALLEQMRS
ncbi:MAG: acyl-CoA synthetase FdrA [Chloroflexota bacterium]|nr:MAG: acyl-CoA synthetase FdrA [Chloroflexota bacterium]